MALGVHCDAAITAQIRYSNKSYRATLTKSILEKCRICDLDAQSVKQILKAAGFSMLEVTNMNKEKVYVKVNSTFDPTGFMQPTSITWSDGRTFPIETVPRLPPRRDC